MIMKRAGLMTGSLLSRRTRHSELALVKTFLLGKVIKIGYNTAYNFGSAVHEEFLVNKKSKRKLTAEEQKDLKGMMNSLRKHPIVKKLMVNLICEKRQHTELNKIKLGFTPDGLHRLLKWIIDLKTTSCQNITVFTKKCIEYGYFRQGVTYMIATKAKEFYIIGIQKSSPYKVYIVRLQDFKNELRYAEEELAFLLYIYSNYGIPNILIKRPRKHKTTDRNGKERKAGDGGNKSSARQNKRSPRSLRKGSKKT